MVSNCHILTVKILSLLEIPIVNAPLCVAFLPPLREPNVVYNCFHLEIEVDGQYLVVLHSPFDTHRALFVSRC